MPQMKTPEPVGKTPVPAAKAGPGKVPGTGLGSLDWLQGKGYAQQTSLLSPRTPPADRKAQGFPIGATPPGQAAGMPAKTGPSASLPAKLPKLEGSAEASVHGAVASGELERKSAAGLLQMQGEILSGKASVGAEGKLDLKDAKAGAEASAEANLAAGSLHVASPIVPLTIGREQLEAQAYADLKAQVGAKASGDIYVTALDGGKVTPRLTAGAEAFVGASGSATVGADIWWQRRDPMTYFEGARVALDRYVLPRMDAGAAGKVRDAIGLAERTGLLDEVAAAIIGDAGRADLLSASATAKGHAGAGAEASLDVGLKGGMVKVEADVGAALGLGGSAGGSIGVAPVDAGRLLLVLLSQGSAVEAQLEQLVDFLKDRFDDAVHVVLKWMEDHARELDDYMRESNPGEYEKMVQAQKDTAEAGQRLLKEPSLDALGDTASGTVRGLYHSGMVGVSSGLRKLGITQAPKPAQALHAGKKPRKKSGA